MTTVRGKLTFSGWEEPWTVKDEKKGEEIDLKSILKIAFNKMDGQKASLTRTSDSNTLTITVDEASHKVLKVEEISGNMKTIILKDTRNDACFTNVRANLIDILAKLNGEEVTIELEDGKRISIQKVCEEKAREKKNDHER